MSHIHGMQLHQFPLWADLQAQEMDQLLEIVSIKGYQAGSMLFGPDDSPDHIFLLQHGRVKTFVLSPQGQEKIMHIFCPGDAFGGLLLGVMDGHLPWAQAMDDVVVCLMDETAFKQFMQRCPNTCLGLFRYMSAHHIDDMRRLERLLHTKASHRVVLTLLDLADRLGFGEAEAFTIGAYFTHEDIANMIGVVRSTVSELISQLRRLGVLSGRGRGLTIHRAAAISFLAEDQ